MRTFTAFHDADEQRSEGKSRAKQLATENKQTNQKMVNHLQNALTINNNKEKKEEKEKIQILLWPCLQVLLLSLLLLLVVIVRWQERIVEIAGVNGMQEERGPCPGGLTRLCFLNIRGEEEREENMHRT